MGTGAVCDCDGKTKFCNWCDPQRVIKSMRAEIVSLKADRVGAKEELREAFVAGVAMGRGQSLIGFDSWYQNKFIKK